jgi:hypothetical protein
MASASLNYYVNPNLFKNTENKMLECSNLVTQVLNGRDLMAVAEESDQWSRQTNLLGSGVLVLISEVQVPTSGILVPTSGGLVQTPV